MLYLKSCHIVDEFSNYHDDILIEGKKIKLIGRDKIQRYIDSYTNSDMMDRNGDPSKRNKLRSKIETWDVDEALVMPSFADLHFHLRNPGQSHKETLLSANRAALKGGYTHFLAMANTHPAIDSAELVQDITDRNEQLDMCTLFQAASVTRGLLGQKLTDFKTLRTKTRFFSDDGRNIDDEKLMEEALFLSREHDFVILDHSEDEEAMVKRNIRLAHKTKGRLHLCHISTKAAMQEIIRAKDKGVDITAEVSPHHIFMDSNAYKVNPPFASKEDRLFLIKSIKEGYIDAIATDHAPHTAEDKANGAPGISGIETAFSLCHRVFSEEDIPLTMLSRLLSGFPGRFLEISPKLIAEGMTADITIAEENLSVINSACFESKGKNTPFEGFSVDSVIIGTIKEGVILYDGKNQG